MTLLPARWAPLPALGLLALTAGLAPLTAPGCQTYAAPPEVSIVGLQDGLLADATLPLQLSFSKAIDPATLRFRVSTDVRDIEGKVTASDNDPVVSETLLFAHAPEGDQLGTSSLSDDHLSMTVTPAAAFPVGPELALIVSAGLSDDAGHNTAVGRRVVFGYKFQCGGKAVADAGPGVFPSGAYFFSVSVKQPAALVLNLIASIKVDPATGAFEGQFSHAARNADPAHCPPGLSCPSSMVCRTLPAPACVVLSEPIGTADEFPDYVPDTGPPTGFSFTAKGCAEVQPDGSISFATSPVDATVPRPAVIIKGVVLNASFSVTNAAPPSLRGTGAMTASQVLLLNIDSGPGAGMFDAVSIPADQVPPGLPNPPAN